MQDLLFLWYNLAKKGFKMLLLRDLPKELENFIIQTANEKQISPSEVVQRAFEAYLHELRIQNYKNDIELIKQGKMQGLTAEEVFGDVRKMIDELWESFSRLDFATKSQLYLNLSHLIAKNEPTHLSIA